MAPISELKPLLVQDLILPLLKVLLCFLYEMLKAAITAFVSFCGWNSKNLQTNTPDAYLAVPGLNVLIQALDIARVALPCLALIMRLEKPLSTLPLLLNPDLVQYVLHSRAIYNPRFNNLMH